MSPATQRLWLTEPRRKTALAEVVSVRGDAFCLDRSLYCPKSRTYRHPQPADHGTVWTPDGEKRRLVTVFDDGTGLWHRLRGAVPRVGDRLQCHLDVTRREEVARAHTALHLILDAWPQGAGRLVADPEVRGGGHVRLMVSAPFLPPPLLAAWRQEVVRAVQADLRIGRVHVSDTLVAHRVAPQPFAEGPYPGPATTRECVEVEGQKALPCDGTHAARTGEVGDVVVQQAHPARRGGSVLVWRVRRPG